MKRPVFSSYPYETKDYYQPAVAVLQPEVINNPSFRRGGVEKRGSDRPRELPLPQAAPRPAVADLLRWAIACYPTRAEPPPDIAALRLTGVELRWLFAQVPTRRAHLALVDQAAIRNRMKADAGLMAVLRAAWTRNAEPGWP
jgi:hypothetical protein